MLLVGGTIIYYMHLTHFYKKFKFAFIPYLTYLLSLIYYSVNVISVAEIYQFCKTDRLTVRNYCNVLNLNKLRCPFLY